MVRFTFGPTDVNDGRAWSETDIEDLKGHVAYGATLEETAEFLCRAETWEEVAAKAKELGLTWQMGGSTRRKPKRPAVAEPNEEPKPGEPTDGSSG